jgi:fluoride exporter
VTALLVALGAAVGAPLRYLIDRAVQARHDSVFPWGTFTAHITGSFLLGLLASGLTIGHLPHQAGTLLGTGLCGALTTYSTFGYETFRLLEDRSRPYAVLNVVASVIAGLGAAFFGVVVAQAIWH